MKEYYLKEEIYYRKNEFRENRLTLVFIHGLSGSSSAWLPYEKIFENKYNVITYDIRGHGKSKKFPNYSDYEIKNFAGDLYDLVSHLSISKFILISHSFASLPAAEYIKLHPENVLVVVFLSPIFDLEKSFLSKISRPILKLSKILGLFPFNSKPRGQIDYAKYRNTTDWSIRRNYADVKNTTLRVYLHSLKQSLKVNQEYLLEKIKVPTLIIHGARDTMAPVANSITLSKKIKNSQLMIIPDIDHIVVLNKVKEVSDAIESFIEKHKGSFPKTIN